MLCKVQPVTISASHGASTGYVENEIYLNCEGNIFLDCDMSYKSQRNLNDPRFLCHVNDLDHVLGERLEEIRKERDNRC